MMNLVRSSQLHAWHLIYIPLCMIMFASRVYISISCMHNILIMHVIHITKLTCLYHYNMYSLCLYMFLR